MISKAIKQTIFSYKEDNNSKFAKIIRPIREFFLFKIYYPIDHFFHRYNERVRRSLAWAKFTWLNYDFDSAYLYDVMSFKLKRIYKSLEKGSSVQEKKNMDALKELIAICNRLTQEYDDKYHEAHRKKWKIKYDFKRKPVKDKDGNIIGYKSISSTSRAKTKKQKAQENKEFLECYTLGSADRSKDIDRLAQILKEHAKTWWD